MKVSYLDYSISVIISRALPDIRDGLSPCTADPVRDARPESLLDRPYRKWRRSPVM